MRRFVSHSLAACVDSGQRPKEAEKGCRVGIMYIRLVDIECEPFDHSLCPSHLLPRPPARAAALQREEKEAQQATGSSRSTFVGILATRRRRRRTGWKQKS